MSKIEKYLISDGFFKRKKNKPINKIEVKKEIKKEPERDYKKISYEKIKKCERYVSILQNYLKNVKKKNMDNEKWRYQSINLDNIIDDLYKSVEWTQ